MLSARPHDRLSLIRAWRHADVQLMLACLAASLIGIVAVFSATRHRLATLGLSETAIVSKQISFVIVGLVVMAIVTFVDYRNLRPMAPYLFGGTIVLLLLVRTPLGSQQLGTQARFDLGPYQFQPSEWAKITMVVCIAVFCA